MNAALPKITIVTPVYNQRDLLEACIDSILSQNYPSLEYIIMDGGSTDGSVELIKKHERHLAHWRSEPDGGPYAAINKGFELSTGDIMGWLNSDDLLHRRGLSHLADIFTRHPEVEFLTGRRRGFTANGDIHDNPSGVLFQFTRELYLREENLVFPETLIMQEGTYWRRSLWEKAGCTLDLHFRYAGDFELWARFFRFVPLYSTNYPIGGFRSHSEEQRSRKYWDLYVSEAHEIIKRERELNLPPRPFDREPVPFILMPDSPWEPKTTPIFECPPSCMKEMPPRFHSQKFSIITVALADKRKLRHCIESVLSQNCSDLEYYVIDVDPTEESRKALQEYSGRLTVIQSAKNEFVQVLDATLRSTTGEIMNISPAGSKYDLYSLRVVSTLFARRPEVE